jgi:hypothetical protein
MLRVEQLEERCLLSGANLAEINADLKEAVALNKAIAVAKADLVIDKKDLAIVQTAIKDASPEFRPLLTAVAKTISAEIAADTKEIAQFNTALSSLNTDIAQDLKEAGL